MRIIYTVGGADPGDPTCFIRGALFPRIASLVALWLIGME